MKKIAILFILATIALAASARSLSYIEKSGSWYYLYDEKGHKYKTVSVSSAGNLAGYSSEIIVCTNGSWIYVYDNEMKRLYTGTVSSIGSVQSVTGETFTTRNGNWIYTYNKNGRRLSTRSAH